MFEVNKNAKNNGSYEDALKYKYYTEEISQVLYPNDSNYAGRLLKIKTRIFLCKCRITRYYKKM
ncbi:MAG: glycogen/starch/alpha-glucan phosphorylase [Intestinibacter bartlettii]